MLIAEPDSPTRQTISLKPLVAVLLLFFVVLFGSMTFLYSARVWLGSLLLTVLAVFLVAAIYSALRARYTSALCYFLPHIAIAVLLLFVGLASSITGMNFADTLRLHLFSQADCINTATSIGDGQVFGVCVRRYDNYFVTANLIVYDSSDQIALPAEQRSVEWNRIFERMTPFGALEFTSRSMGHHFYDVDFFDPNYGK